MATGLGVRRPGALRDAEELVQISDRVQEILEPYNRRFGHPDERPAGARQVSYIRFAFPSDGII